MVPHRLTPVVASFTSNGEIGVAESAALATDSLISFISLMVGILISDGGDLTANFAPHAALATFGGEVCVLPGIGGALAATFWTSISSSVLTSESVVEVGALDSDSEEEESESEVGEDTFAGVADEEEASLPLVLLPLELLATAEVASSVAALATVDLANFSALVAAFRPLCDKPLLVLMTAHGGTCSAMGPRAGGCDVVVGCGKQKL